MSAAPPLDPPEALTEEIDVRAVAVRMTLGIGGFMVLIGAIAYAFMDSLTAMGAWFVDTLGPLGVALGFFIPDAFTLPVPHEGIATLAIAGGMNFWITGISASIGSLTGGSVGWWLGKNLSGTDLFNRVMGKKGVEARVLMQRYGEKAVIFAAISPVPYSLMAWSAGALGMGFRRFFWVSLWRIPRVFFYLALIKLGFVSFGGD